MCQINNFSPGRRTRRIPSALLCGVWSRLGIPVMIRTHAFFHRHLLRVFALFGLWWSLIRDKLKLLAGKSMKRHCCGCRRCKEAYCWEERGSAVI
ncbi:hypothetical protein DM02DRAFT_298964 [Periconia macrospinosa]|uniref:Uncharacterized protein n=1 Tax=Periconia macrospinosa TaxID=97972 RepID=A0A2V1DZ09_9PLEO|nr:hypothetical protein DM02DRAFT_298964 [Periconia macrospinosa]